MGRERALLVWLLVLVLGALAAVAYATPPDPTYISGLWDDAVTGRRDAGITTSP